MERKTAYFEKLKELFDTYSKILLVNADNVGSHQMQQVRTQLRGRAVVLMGKNTMIRKCIRDNKNAKLAKLIPLLKFNVGLVFTNDDLKDVRKVILDNKVGAPARAGSIAPCTVVVPAGNTGMEPTKTSFFQALNIQTKITKGTVEIINDVVLLKPGDKVGNSEATLLQVLNIKPFSYALTPVSIYDDGSIFDPAVLDLSDDDLLQRFNEGLANISAISLATGIPSISAVPHLIVNGFKNVAAVGLETDFIFEQIKKLKEMLDNPDAFKVAAPTVTTTTTAPTKKVEEKEEVKEESDGDMGFSLFD